MFFKSKKRIYLDYAASTPLDLDILKNTNKILKDVWANPSSLHQEGLKAKKVLEESRLIISKVLNSKVDEVIFTGGGTESNNLAILGVIKSIKKKNPEQTIKFITTKLEHPSQSEACIDLEKVETVYLKVTETGKPDLTDLKNILSKNTAIVSVSIANGDIGTINETREIANVIREFKKKNSINMHEAPYLHVDISQGVSFMEISFDSHRADMVTMDGSKIYGPRGVGCLVKKKYVDLEKIIAGGKQEFNLRPGTESVINCFAFAKALEKANSKFKDESKRVETLRDFLLNGLQEIFSDLKINGSRKNRLPNNLNICLPNINAEYAVICLDEIGISVSYSTACETMSKNLGSNAVKEVSGEECYKSSIRFSLGKETNILQV
jgi:cysteine desulfurase